MPVRKTAAGDSTARDAVAAAVAAEGVAMAAGFRGFVGRGQRRCRRVGPLEHSRRAAETTLLLHHPVLLETEHAIQQIASVLAKVTATMANG